MGDYGFDGAGEFGGTDFPETSKCGNECECSKQNNGPKEFEIYKDSSNEFRWRLRAKNGRIIASSGEGFKNKADIHHSINLVKNADSSTNTQDLT